jgi:hypothetical protein
MDAYLAAKERYYVTIEVSSGCGARAQGYIDKAFQDLRDAHSQLSPQERLENPLPKQAAKSYDDGVGGFSGAVTNMARNDDCRTQ